MSEKVRLVVARDVRMYTEYEIDLGDAPVELRGDVLAAAKAAADAGYCDEGGTYGDVPVNAAVVLSCWGREIGSTLDDQWENVSILPAWEDQ